MKTLYYNGRIYTGDGEGLREAFIIEDGHFVKVGSNEELRSEAEGMRCIDLCGHFVCPGFNDSHMHLLNYGKALKTADLSRSTDSVASIIAKVRAFIEEEHIPEGAWVIGRGWNQDYFTDGQGYPLREELDKISMKHPIALTRACGHMLVTNTRALEVLGVKADTEAPYGGRIELDEDGEPNGIFRENAMDLVTSAFPVPDRAKLKEMILAASAALNSYGITSVQSDDLLCFSNVPYEEVLNAYRELRAEGKLTVRVYEQSLFMDVEGLKDFCEKGYRTGLGDEWFRIGPLKLLGDGSLGTRTAFLDRAYNDDKGTCGMALLSQEELNTLFEYADSHGMQIAVHVIGNGILDRVLEAYEHILIGRDDKGRDDKGRGDAGQADAVHNGSLVNPMRDGIVHCQIMRADQLDSCERLGLHAYVQSIFLDYDINIVKDRVGDELAGTSYNFKRMYDGMRASNGSDCPVELPFVMGGIQCAITRRTLKMQASDEAYLPEQALTVDEALRSFTVNGAYASFEEDIKGQIREGMLADFTVLSENPFEVDSFRIKDIKVLGTFTGGSCVYKA